MDRPSVGGLTEERLSGALTTRRIFWSLGILFVFLILHWLLPDDLPQRTLLLGAGATVCVLIGWLSYRPRLKRKMTKASTEKLGLSFPIQEHWELHEHGLAHAIDETDMMAPWHTLQTLKELKGGFHMNFHTVGLAFIPNRAFADDKERRLWRARLRAHLVDRSRARA